MFNIGDKVVCVDDSACCSGSILSGLPCGLTKGAIYCIEWCDPCVHRDGTLGGLIVGVSGIENGLTLYGERRGYCVTRFRKVQPKSERVSKKSKQPQPH